MTKVIDLERLQDLHWLEWASLETINKLIECNSQIAIQEAKEKVLQWNKK